MDSHSRSASPRDQPRPQQRPPSPPSPHLPPAAFDNRAYHHDDADPNHNESFTSNGAHQNGHSKEPNGDNKSPEAVNLELINMTPKNGSLKKKKDVEVDMNGSNPYDEYFVPVNEHRKYMRGEKLYVTADKRGEKGGCKRPLCWTLLALVVVAIVALIVLAATGVIFSNTPTPADPYNVSISAARALGGIGQSLDSHHQDDHDHRHHDNDQDQNMEHTTMILEEDTEQPDEDPNQSESNHDHNEHNQDGYLDDHEENSQEQHGPMQVSNQDQEAKNESENHEPDFVHVPEQRGEPQEPDHQHQDQVSPDSEQSDQAEQKDSNHDQEHNNQNNRDQIQEPMVPEPIHEEGRSHSVVPEAIDTSIYVPRTVEGELEIENEEFSDAYHDPESDQYKKFTESFKEALTRTLFDQNTLDTGDNDIKIEVIQLRPGSVIVTYRIHWKPKNSQTPEEDILNATTLEQKLNNHLLAHNRMIGNYYIAEEHLSTKPVLDLCQINKDDCQEGCEFDESSLDFICTCPQGSILNINNLKTCVPDLPSLNTQPIENTSSQPDMPVSETVTQKSETNQILEQSNGFIWKDIQAETTIIPELEHKLSITSEENFNQKDLEPEHNVQINRDSEITTKQTYDPNISVTPAPQSEDQSLHQPFPSILPDETQNGTNTSENHEYNVDDKNQLHDEYTTSVDKTVEQNTAIINEPMTQEEPKNKTLTEQHIPSDGVTEFNVNDQKIEFGHQPSQYSDTSYNINEAFESHQEIKPEEVYTEEPESPLSDTEENSPKDEQPNIENYVSKSSNLTEVLSPTITEVNSDPGVWAKPDNENNVIYSSTPLNPNIVTEDSNFTSGLSHELNQHIILQQTEVDSSPGKKEINDTDITNDETNDWLSDTSTTDNKTHVYSGFEDDGTIVSFNNENHSSFGNETESQSFKSNNNEPDFITTVGHVNTYDVNSVLNNDLNVTQDETQQYNLNTRETSVDLVAGRSLDTNNINDYTKELKSETDFDGNKKETNRENSDDMKEDAPILNETNKNKQEVSAESEQNDTATTDYKPQVFLTAMDTLQEPSANETQLNISEFDNGKYVTYDDINMLLNRSSKSMNNLTQDENVKESDENLNNNESEPESKPSKPNNSVWTSETATEVNYNNEKSTMDKTETTESMKTIVDHIMLHSKDDYEPDYLTKTDDSMYVMERDYESEDPRKTKINTEIITNTTVPTKQDNVIVDDISNEPITNVTESVPINPSLVIAGEASITSTLPSTTVVELIYNTSPKNVTSSNDTWGESTTSSVLPHEESMPVSNTLNEISMFEITTNQTSHDRNLISVETSTPNIIAPINQVDESFNNTDTINKSIENHTQINNLDVTIYETSHHTENDSMPSKAFTPQTPEYEDHEIEMNPFLPEIENNKHLVKKLQEGHDLEFNNMNETQNESSDEHHGNSTENSAIVNNEHPVKVDMLEEHINTTTYFHEQPRQEKSKSDVQNEDNPSLQKPEQLENSDNNQILQDVNLRSEQGVLPISTFLMDTDDLDTSTSFNKITNPTSHTDIPLSRFTDTNTDNLNVVPIIKDVDENNSPVTNTKLDSRYGLNDISDMSKSSEKRTVDVTNFDTDSDNRS